MKIKLDVLYRISDYETKIHMYFMKIAEPRYYISIHMSKVGVSLVEEEIPEEIEDKICNDLQVTECNNETAFRAFFIRFFKREMI